MLFNSYIFIFLFLPITLIAYYVIAKFNKKICNVWLLLASLVFYGWFSLSYSILFIISIVTNYLFSIGIKRRKKLFILFTGVLFNLGIIFFFKYKGFFLDNINLIFNTSYSYTNLVLPIGISFFTFQQIAFLVSCFKENEGDISIVDYALFVSFFPQLIAGPIVLHNELIPQLQDDSKKSINWENFSKGFNLFVYGLAKKVLLADSFGNIVNIGYENISGLGTINAILVILGFTFELYFDFSGYSDMACGLAKMFNIDLPHNFDSPYKACDIREFWKRWHITLTRFLTMSIYIPLGGNRKGTVRTCINYFIVFLLSGIWHGAAWTFVVWGIMHGIAYILSYLKRDFWSKMHPVFSWGVTFAFVNVAWIVFRANSFADVKALLIEVMSMNMTPIKAEFQSHFFNVELEVLCTLFSNVSVYLAEMVKNCWVVLIYTLGLAIILGGTNIKEKVDNMKPKMNSVIMVGVIFLLCVVSMNSISTFLYFNF